VPVYQDDKLQLDFFAVLTFDHGITISFPVSLLAVDVNESAISSADQDSILVDTGEIIE
jgi:hypothetical protein